MLHRRRTWCVSPAESTKELARKLTGTAWCCCTGFELGGYWFLNDSTCPDGAQAPPYHRMRGVLTIKRPSVYLSHHPRLLVAQRRR